MKTQKQNKSIFFKGKDFFLGIDVYKKQCTVTIRDNGLALKTLILIQKSCFYILINTILKLISIMV